MYSRQNNNKTKSSIWGVLLVLLVLLIWRPWSHGSRHDVQPGNPGNAINIVTGTPTHNAAPAVPVRNPIDEALKVPPGTEKRPGVAAAILIDTSGSMNDMVSDGRGGKKRKIDIAKACLGSLVDQTADFSSKHADKTILLGIYEFSERGSTSCRTVAKIGKPDPAAAKSAIAALSPKGNTPIGDSMIVAKRDLDATGLSRLHILVITDGENNHGYDLGDVVSAMSRLDEQYRPAMYFVAFNVAEAKFADLRKAGATVLPAGNAEELKQTLDYVLTGKILVEEPELPKK